MLSGSKMLEIHKLIKKNESKILKRINDIYGKVEELIPKEKKYLLNRLFRVPPIEMARITNLLITNNMYEMNNSDREVYEVVKNSYDLMQLMIELNDIAIILYGNETIKNYVEKNFNEENLNR